LIMARRITLILYGEASINAGERAVTIRADRIEIEKPEKEEKKDALTINRLFDKRFRKETKHV